MIDSTAIAREALLVLSELPEIRHPKVVPTERSLAAAFETIFWSSLDSYEGAPVKARLFFAPRAALGPYGSALQLLEPKPLSVESVRRLAPAHGDRGGLIVVEQPDGSLCIEGLLGRVPFVRNVSPWWLAVECRGVGAVRITSAQTPVLDFRRGAVRRLGGLSFDRTSAEFLLMGAGIFPERDVADSWRVASALIDIAFDIDELGVGGALWILNPSKRDTSEVRRLGNPVAPKSALWDPYREMWEDRTTTIRLLNPGCNLGHEFLQQAAQEWDLLRRSSVTGSIADLSRIDGATLLSSAPELLEFGVICNRFTAPATTVLRSTNPSSA